MSFWDERTPCWKLVNCSIENREHCGAYLAQHYPCWELPLEKRCPAGDRVGSCEECPVYLTYSEDYQAEVIAQAESKSIKILVVDDELLIRWSLYQALRKAGFEVALAADGNEAIEKVGKSFFKFVLVDMKLPNWDGFALSAEIQNLAPASRVILMTAYGTEETEQRARDLGIKYLPKPLDLDHITEIFQQ